MKVEETRLSGFAVVEKSSDPGNSNPYTGSERNARLEILNAAAECFMRRGFAATSIDDVANRLNATKGRIYHYFRSKTDLFFDVYRHGMELNFKAVRPALEIDNATDRLRAMALNHAIALMQHQPFQRVLTEGVFLHQQGATTAAQRTAMEELIGLRNDYEAMFREAIENADAELSLGIEDSSIAVKSLLAVLNSTVFWYTPRGEDVRTEQKKIAGNLTAYALLGLGIDAKDTRNGR